MGDSLRPYSQQIISTLTGLLSPRKLSGLCTEMLSCAAAIGRFIESPELEICVSAIIRMVILCFFFLHSKICNNANAYFFIKQ